jgi:hypothetical protein
MVSTRQEQKKNTNGLFLGNIGCGGKKKKTLNAQAITKLLPVLIVLQWVSAFGVVQNYHKIDIAITSD